MASLGDHLRSKILGCAAEAHGFGVILQLGSQTIVDDFDVTFCIDQNILQLKVPVGDVLGMEVAQG